MTKVNRFGEYLLKVKSHLHLDERLEKRIIAELYEHIIEKAKELEDTGTSTERCNEQAIKAMGRPRVIARVLYEAHSAGSPKDALLTGLPYLLVSLLFATHMWRNPILAPGNTYNRSSGFAGRIETFLSAQF